MKNILVPTDFSEVAKNAAEYALKLAVAVGAQKIILYNAYQAPIVNEPSVPAMQMLDFDTLKEISNNGLQQLKSELATIPNTTVTIETHCDYNVINAGIDEVCSQLNVDLVVMGITGGNDFEEVLIGSTATAVAQHTQYPVLIIPPNACYKPIGKLLFACDYKKVATTTPVNEMKKVFGKTGALLDVLHVEEHEKGTHDFVEARRFLEEAFSEYHPSFYFVTHKDFVEGLQEFVQAHPADIIVTIPKKHGFFERLFKRSHIKHLAFHTDIPLLCIHEPEG